MIAALLDRLFGCRHRRLSRVMPVPRTDRHYVVCLECGKAFGYDWSRMKICQPLPVHATHGPVVVEH